MLRASFRCLTGDARVIKRRRVHAMNEINVNNSPVTQSFKRTESSANNAEQPVSSRGRDNVQMLSVSTTDNVGRLPLQESGPTSQDVSPRKIFSSEDFSLEDMSGRNFAGSHFVGCTFDHAYIVDTDLSGCDFEDCSFTNTSFLETNLRDASFKGCDQSTDITFMSCKMESVDFSSRGIGGDITICESNAMGLDLSHATLKKFDVNESDVSYAKCERAMIDDVQIRNSNLRGATFKGAVIRKLAVDNCDWNGVNFDVHPAASSSLYTSIKTCARAVGGQAGEAGAQYRPITLSTVEERHAYIGKSNGGLLKSIASIPSAADRCELVNHLCGLLLEAKTVGKENIGATARALVKMITSDMAVYMEDAPPHTQRLLEELSADKQPQRPHLSKATALRARRT